jgi:hypothetical protein
MFIRCGVGWNPKPVSLWQWILTLLWSFSAPVCLKWIEHLLRILAWEGWRIITTFLNGQFLITLLHWVSSIEMRLLDSDSSPTFETVDFLQSCSVSCWGITKWDACYILNIQNPHMSIESNNCDSQVKPCCQKPWGLQKKINLSDQFLWISWKSGIGHGPKGIFIRRFRELGIWYFAGVAWGELSNCTLCIRGKLQKTIVRMASVPAKIQTELPTNTSLKW